MLSATYFGLAVVSALVPWVNAEVLMLSAVPLAGSRTKLAWLVALVTLGQMTGKSAMYWISRRSTERSGAASAKAGLRWKKMQATIERWRDLFVRRPGAALGITLISAIAGVPPFYAVSIAAGALRVAFGPFVAIGTLGRLIHFTLVAFIPDLVRRSL